MRDLHISSRDYWQGLHVSLVLLRDTPCTARFTHFIARLLHGIARFSRIIARYPLYCALYTFHRTIMHGVARFSRIIARYPLYCALYAFHRTFTARYCAFLSYYCAIPTVLRALRISSHVYCTVLRVSLVLLRDTHCTARFTHFIARLLHGIARFSRLIARSAPESHTPHILPRNYQRRSRSLRLSPPHISRSFFYINSLQISNCCLKSFVNRHNRILMLNADHIVIAIRSERTNNVRPFLAAVTVAY